MNSSETTPEFEALLDYLKHDRGCDLTGYKRSTLLRRFQHRMQSIHIETYQTYLQYLQFHPEEHLSLLNDVLINFTEFFRDPETWAYLANDVIPGIIASKQPDEPIRVWSAGCAGGQEIYSLVILFAETLGIAPCSQRVRFFATDADKSALRQARQGTYSDVEVADIPPDLLSKYFERTERGYEFHQKLRQQIVFGHHDLSKDAPMSKIDLLVCRNVLIYFNLDAQLSILVRFHFALKNTGFLFIGKSETLVHRRQIFTPMNLKHRVYIKGLHLELEDQLTITARSHPKQCTTLFAMQNSFWQKAFESSPVAQFAIDLQGCLLNANEQANRLFGLTLDDWNQPFHNLEPGKLIFSQTSIKNIYGDHPVLLQDLEWNTSQSKRYFDVSIVPVMNAKNQVIGSALTFLEKTEYKQLSDRLKRTNLDLERIAEALKTTQAELEAAYQEIQLLTRNTEYGD